MLSLDRCPNILQTFFSKVIEIGPSTWDSNIALQGRTKTSKWWPSGNAAVAM